MEWRDWSHWSEDNFKPATDDHSKWHDSRSLHLVSLIPVSIIMDNRLLMISTAVCLCVKRRRPKKQWVKQWLLNRRSLSHVNLMNELTLEPSDWRNYLRMDEDTYFKLLQMVTPLIKKQDTNMRQSINAHERLAATLRFLASGMSYEELKFVTAISPQHLGIIIPETCLAILKCLINDYLKVSSNFFHF